MISAYWKVHHSLSVFLSVTQFYDICLGNCCSYCFWLNNETDRIFLWYDINFVFFFSAFPSEDFDDSDDAFSSLTINDPIVLEICLHR